jgi:dienelactone hydrolase
MLDSGGKAVIRGTTEHTMAGIGALLVGRQLATDRIWDGFRALDYLASRPEVDPARLGCTGNSGGGTMTAYLMALDERISVAAPSCYITSLERLFATLGPQDAEQNIIGQVAAGMEHADFVTMRAPKPTLLSVGTRDFFDIQGSWDTFREVKLIYGRMGFGERVELFESDEEHGFTKPRRVSVARWMKRWLLKRDESIDELEFKIASDAELQCTQSGQVLTDFKGVSVFDLNRERDRELREARRANRVRLKNDEFRAAVKEHLGLTDWKPAPISVKNVNLILKCFATGNSFTLEVDPGIEIAASEVRVGQQGENALTVVVVRGASAGHPRTDATAPWADATSYFRTITLDLPGLTVPGAGAQERSSPFGSDWREAFVGMSMNKPLLGLRAAALLNVLMTLDDLPDQRRHRGFHVVGLGTAGRVILHAALLDQKGLIKKVSLHRSLISWSNIIEKGLSRDQLASVVPGALKLYDLPDLVARLAPLPVEIVQTVDAEGKLVPVGEVKEAYAIPIQAYGDSGKLEIK